MAQGPRGSGERDDHRIAEGNRKTHHYSGINSFLTKTVAIADGRYDLLDAAGNPTRKMWTSIVLTREHSGWRIAAIRNMLPAH
jgi:hypothetical protein